MGSIIVKSLQLLVRLLEWEQARLVKQEEKLEAKRQAAIEAAELSIGLHYEKARRKIREAREARDRAQQQIEQVKERDCCAIESTQAKLVRKAALDSTIVNALQPILK